MQFDAEGFLIGSLEQPRTEMPMYLDRAANNLLSQWIVFVHENPGASVARDNGRHACHERLSFRLNINAVTTGHRGTEAPRRIVTGQTSRVDASKPLPRAGVYLDRAINVRWVNGECSYMEISVPQSLGGPVTSAVMNVMSASRFLSTPSKLRTLQATEAPRE